MLSKFFAHMRKTALTIGAVLLIAVLLGLMFSLPFGNGEAVETAPEEGAPEAQTEEASLGELTWTLIRLSLPIIGALVAVPVILSRLVNKLHDVRDTERSHNVLNRLTFGQLGRYPYIIAREGRLATDKRSITARVGGPLRLVVYNDTAVVTEQYGRLSQVLGPGIHQLDRMERVWQAVDIRPQHWVLPVFGMTKEGLPVRCEADLRFQIADQHDGKREETHEENLYPFSEDAVFKAATSVWIREPDHPERVRTWVGRVVIGYAEGLLRNILANYRLDWLLAPAKEGQPHPREAIRQELEEGLKKRVGNVGAKLISAEIGTIELQARDEEVTQKLNRIIPKQRIESWYSDWKVRELTNKAESEAQLLQLDATRIQAQAEMIVTLTEALQSTILRRGTIEPYLLAMRFVEALRWMSYSTVNREFMPPEAMLTLNRLQDLLHPDQNEPGEESEERE